jgi:hypothetical protein
MTDPAQKPLRSSYRGWAIRIRTGTGKPSAPYSYHLSGRYDWNRWGVCKVKPTTAGHKIALFDTREEARSAAASLRNWYVRATPVVVDVTVEER